MIETDEQCLAKFFQRKKLMRICYWLHYPQLQILWAQQKKAQTKTTESSFRLVAALERIEKMQEETLHRLSSSYH